MVRAPRHGHVKRVREHSRRARSQGDETVKLSTVCCPISSSVQGKCTHSALAEDPVWSSDHGEVGSSDWP